MNSDWVMVIITGIYVIATIIICRANIKSANSAKEQLKEMRRQYEQANQPEIEVEIHYIQRAWYIVRFVNHGNNTAQHVKICLNQEFIDKLPEESFRKVLGGIKEKECIIGAGQHYDLFIGSNALRQSPPVLPMTGVIEYESQGNSYRSDIFVDLEHYITFFSSTTDEEKTLKALQAIGTELKEIRTEIRNIEKFLESSDMEKNADTGL